MNSRSESMLLRALAVIPEATQTLSKGPSQFVQGPSPIFIERGEGSRVIDIEGREFIDWPMALGPVLLGHGHSRVNQAIRDQLELGISFTLPSPLEVETAEKVVATVPSAEMVRFAKSGSEAVSGAIRLARAITGRELIATSGYHGWHDTFAAHSGRKAGVPQATAKLAIEFVFNDADSLAKVLAAHDEQIAAVILEPAISRPPETDFLADIAGLARGAGAILIYDEIITGFRWAPGGAQEYYGVLPDLTVLGKALGNGMPISAICGPAIHMEHFADIFVSGTHGGECLSLAAASAVLDVVNQTDAIEQIWTTGRALQEGIRARVETHGLGDVIACTGEPPRVVVSVVASPENELILRSLLQQELAKRQILFNGSLFATPAHTEADVSDTLAAFDAAFGVIVDGIRSGDASSLLEGAPISAAFRQA